MQLTQITSGTNPRIKHAVRLRDARYRRKSEQFIVDGLREIYRAMASGLVLESLFVSLSRWSQIPRRPESSDVLVSRDDAVRLIRKLVQEFPGGDGSEGQCLQKIETQGLQFNLVADSVFEKLVYGDRTDGVIAIFRTPDLPITALHLPPHPLVVVLDRIEKPGNIGAILRSADAAGVDAILLVDCATDLMNPNVIRASCGTVFSRRIAVTQIEEARIWLQSHEIRTFALRLEAEGSLWESDLRLGTAFLVGNEAEGLGDRWNLTDIHGIRLPMRGLADSLNASVTTAICLFEAVRQRRV